MLDTIFVFDIETIPDCNAGRHLYGLNNLDDNAVSEAMFSIQQQTKGNEFLPHYLHQVVAISAIFRSHQQLKVWSLGEPNDSEKELIHRFFNGIEKHTPILISWNGSGFDLPVLHYRSLLHGISAPRYWETGEHDQNFRWNNYLNRYHYRHLDLMDVLASYQGKANAPLDAIASLLGFPGKMGMSGASVWKEYQKGNIAGIRNYCETDVLNTYLVYLRFELIRGNLNQDSYQHELTRVRELLTTEQKSHFIEFLEHW